ncbi:hypothetical protein Scep_015068 [Stephania cephalantha]|uniref:SWIM-type domain-containing protein n=1 Tax=Stephania cephalantha TaxID=152367 RepID=A0AAP0J295_9MAGN
MDDLEMARAAFIRDIFGSSDIEGSSHESLGCEDNSVPLVDEVSISNVIHEQDFNIVSRPIPTVGMSFGSLDELLETYQDHAKEKGFVVVIRSSTKDEDGQLKNIFKKVQGEINGMMYCHLDPNNENDTSSLPGVEKFNIKECSINNWYCKEFSYTVEYRANRQYFDCNCRKSESSGLLCRHIFEVIKMKGIARVHERYIMRRWRNDVLRRHLSIVHSRGYPQMTDEYKKFKEIERALHEAVDLCANNPAILGHNIWVMILVFKILIMSLFEILTMFVVEGGRGRTILDQSGKEEELEEIVVKDKVEAKAVKAKVKANQLA